MAAPHTEVEVSEIPQCDFCAEAAKAGGRGSALAVVDGRTVYGAWAYMCEAHFRRFGVGLGLGQGQRLKLRQTA